MSTVVTLGILLLGFSTFSMSLSNRVCVFLLSLRQQVSLRPICPSRLGNLSCLAAPEDLLVYKDWETFGLIQNLILNCTRDEHSLSSRLVGTESSFIRSLLSQSHRTATVSVLNRFPVCYWTMLSCGPPRLSHQPAWQSWPPSCLHWGLPSCRPSRRHSCSPPSRPSAPLPSVLRR